MNKRPKPTAPNKFDTLYGVLNVPQRQAVDAIEGPVMVIAGPGTGKTTILTLRIANILRKTDTAPDNILALTFTESGAFAMRRKLAEIVGTAAYRVNIHTFHGFAEYIIKQYPDYFPRIIGSSIIADAEQIGMIEKIIREEKGIELLRPYGDPTYYVRSVLSEIHILKRENVSPRELRQSVEKDAAELENSRRSDLQNSRSDLEESKISRKDEAEYETLKKRNQKNLELATVYAAYEARLAKNKYYDFDDLLLELVRSLETHPEFKLIIQENYQYILADEHQDANATQNRILELLADFHDNPNLFIVGDDKQAIYRFQGASLENFMFFAKKYPDAKVIELSHNYRSHQVILDASHSVVKRNPTIQDHEPVRLLSLRMGTKPIFVSEFMTGRNEISYITRIIAGLVRDREKPEEIAVLYRENSQAKGIADSLKAMSIPHRVESDFDMLAEPDVMKLIIICRAVFDPSDSENLAYALLIPEMGCDPVDVMKGCDIVRKTGQPLGKVLGVRGGQTSEIRGLTSIIAWSRLSQTMPFMDLIDKIIKDTNMIAHISSSDNSLDRISSLQSFFEYVREVSRSKKTFLLRDFIAYIDVVKDHGIKFRKSQNEHISGVRLMTAHRAKGLEFNHVFIIHAIDGLWGNKTKRNMFHIPPIEHARDAGRIEDERRLFYVAMTRARESVNISYASRMDDKETLPTQFISEISPEFVAFEKVEMGDLDKTALTMTNTVSKDKNPKQKEAISLVNPDIVRSKFLKQPLSVTHINNFLECSWKYFFMNLIRIPEAKSKHQMYGTAIHATLKTYFDAYREDKDMKIADVLKLFRHHLDNEPMLPADREDSYTKGAKALKGYFETYYPAWNRRILTEYAVRGVEFKLDKDHIVLNGNIDKIEFMDDRNVVVVDYKTSKPKSRNEIEGKTKDADGNYKRQLVFYKLILEGYDKNLSMRSGDIDFIEPNPTGKYKKESFEIGESEIAEMKKVIARMAADILSMKFLVDGCGKKDCFYCKMGQILKRSNGK
jgi:DNA helicase-2/ATP-dependent DNA helicase PcrA